MLGKTDLQIVASLVKRKTAGVPRLVYWTIKYLQTKIPLPKPISMELFNEDYLNYMRSNIASYGSLGLYSELDQETSAFYIECVRLAALKIPLDLIPPIKLHFLGTEQTESLPSVTELCVLFSLYCEKVDDGMYFSCIANFVGSFRFIFPELVLENMAKVILNPRLSFWAHLLTATASVTLEGDGGTILESVSRSVIGLRIGETLQLDSSKFYYQLFPFLPKDSFVGSEIVEHAAKGFGVLPKFVIDARKLKSGNHSLICTSFYRK
jgi:hypothetical protein